LVHEFIDPGHPADDWVGFLADEHGGQARGAFGGGGEDDGIEVLMEDFAVEKEESRECLVLGRGGDVLLDGEVGEEGMDPSTGSGRRFRSAHLRGVAFLMQENEAAHPVQIGLFGAARIVFGAVDVARPVEDFLTRALDFSYDRNRITIKRVIEGI